MPKPKGRPKGKAETHQANRTTIINLKGSPTQAEWLESVHRKTHYSKTTIMRLALTMWAQQNGHPPFPMSEDDE